ncbi:MAG TPA: AraC family transcriptional regulator [Tepidisphaeraceae bacterium]
MTSYPQLLQMADLFNYVEDVLAWAKDHEGRFLWVNRAIVMMRAGHQAGAELTDGYREVLGKTDHDFCPAVLADQYQLDDDHVLAGNRIINRIEPFRQPDGTTCWHMTNKIPLFDDRGTVIGTAGIARLLKEADSEVVPGNEFGPVLAHMRDHFHSPITNDELARIAHMSIRAFERKFLRSFHLSPQKYLRKLRVRIASHSLVYTEQPLSEVALNCGFADQSHFTREFRRQFGRTPREYRAHYGEQTAAAGSSTKSAVHALEVLEAPADISRVDESVRPQRKGASAQRRKRGVASRTGKPTRQLVSK